MAWTHYRLCFRLLAPLHVGYRRTGNLMQTRPYVPGRLLWAALTARLTRNAGQGNDAKAYQDVGEQVKTHFRFGYLWPALKPSLKGQDGHQGEKRDEVSPFFPWAHEEDFEYMLLGSAMSTSLHPQQNTAEEGSLHEVEFIAPTTRDGRTVYLLGDLWVKEEEEKKMPSAIQPWQAALRHIQLGGERGCGWGRVALEQCKPQSSGTLALIPKIQWTEENNEVILTVPEGVALPAHALAAGEGALDNGAVQGPVEVLVGWGWHKGEYGLSRATVAYAPGAKAQRGLRARIGADGLWRARSEAGG